MEAGKRVSTLKRGVTLIECCIVVAIAAILAGSALPSFMESNKKRVLDGAVTEVATEVNFARSTAVTQPGGVWLGYSAVAGGTCSLIHAGGKFDCTCDATGQAVCVGEGRALKVTLHSLTIQIAKPILFDAVNGTVTPTATIRVQQAPGREVHHKVNIMGRVRSCSPQAAVAGFVAC